MASRQDIAIADCDKCMRTNSKQIRQSLGCGYEPRPDRVRLMLWQPPDAYKGPPPTVCAGYTTSLPEVQEVALLRLHWENGALRDACGGEQPTEETLGLIVILQGAYNSLKNWIMTPASEGGGGS